MSGPDLVQLVYATRGHGDEEPLVAVVATETEAAAIADLCASAQEPARVSWETLPTKGPVLGLVHLVLLIAGSDPIGIAAYGDLGEAEIFARQQASAGQEVAVRSLPIGWRDEGLVELGK